MRHLNTSLSFHIRVTHRDFSENYDWLLCSRLFFFIFSLFPKRFTKLAHSHHQRQLHKCQEARSTHDRSIEHKRGIWTRVSNQFKLRLVSSGCFYASVAKTKKVSSRNISQFQTLSSLFWKKKHVKKCNSWVREQNKIAQHIKHETPALKCDAFTADLTPIDVIILSCSQH